MIFKCGFDKCGKEYKSGGYLKTHMMAHYNPEAHNVMKQMQKATKTAKRVAKLEVTKKVDIFYCMFVDCIKRKGEPKEHIYTTHAGLQKHIETKHTDGFHQEHFRVHP